MILGGLMVATMAPAQELEVELEPPACLPNRANAPIAARIDRDDGVAGVRLYFRRLHPLGSFYYLDMHRSAPGLYEAVLPRPEDRAPMPLRDEWWRELSSRDWLAGLDREWLESWLAESDYEPVEFFVAVHDDRGERVLQTPVEIIAVRAPEECEISLSPQQSQWAADLRLGETTAQQADRPPFHWSCTGVSERISAAGERSRHRACARVGADS